eukprot:s1811_g5.t1
MFGQIIPRRDEGFFARIFSNESEAGWDRRHRRVGVATLQPATVMRVDAAEFVPLAGSSSADGSWIQGSSHPATFGGVENGLSADSPAFDVSWQAPPWEVWHGQDYAAPVPEYNPPDSSEAAPIDTFLTPQLLDEIPEQVHSLPLSPKSGKEAQDDGSLSDALPQNDHATASLQDRNASHSHPADSFFINFLSPAAGTGGAASSTCPSATAGSSAGVLSVHGRKLLWTLTGRDCQSCNDLFVLDEWPQGEGVESQRFVVAGLVLRLVFFPAGSALTGDGDCAVGLLSEDTCTDADVQDKAKLKFELFLNDRRSGTKVMLGQKFSALDVWGPNGKHSMLNVTKKVATFEAWLGNRARGSKQLYTAPTGSFSQPIEGKPDFSSETDTITVGLEVYSNLMLGLR